MKVSILTYHWEDNYGATMQAYATYQAIKFLGHNPEFIDLRLPYKPSLKSRLIFGLKRFRFNNFRRKYFKNLTQRTYWSVEDLRKTPPKADCYLVGSDQTWNPKIAGELLPAFFLTFGDVSIRRISYATSIGLNQWETSPYISDASIRTALSKFNKILLREDSAVNICKDMFDSEAKQVIDPVLLFSDYSELIGKVMPSNEIVTYKLVNDEGFYEIASNFANKKNIPIRSIGSIRRPKGYKASYPESITNWIKRIAASSYVLTDSFHGTVFSLLYHRPFVIYVGDTQRVTRIESLLKQLNLEERILSKGASSDDIVRLAEKEINWPEIDRKLGLLREESLELLKSALS